MSAETTPDPLTSDPKTSLDLRANGAQDDINDDIDPENEVTGVKLLLIHISLCLCTFLVGLDFNLIATAIPVITVEFNSIRDVGWYGSAFMVALCASQPLAGKTYTLFSKKIAYLIYLFVFEVGSLVCALAPTSAALIAGRVVAGLGASGVFAGGFTLLTTIIPLHKRAIWTGTFSSVFALASIIGPVLGGALTQHLTWRWCFYINLPIGGAAAVLFFFLVHLRPGKLETQPLKFKLESLDGLGFVLIAASITMLLLALIWGGVEHPWSSSVEIGLFVGAVVIFTLFIFWQIHRGEKALIPPRLFTINRNPALLCAAAFFVNGPFQVIIYWLPIWFQAVLRTTPTQSRIDYFPTVIADVLAAFIGAGIVMQLGWWNPFLLFAEVGVSLGGGLLSTLYPGISDGHWIGYQIFGGIGYSLASNISHLGMQASLPQDLVPIGSSTLLAVISTSCAVFNAVAQAVFQQRMQINLGRIVPAETVMDIINAGALNFEPLVAPDKLPMVINAYSKSITQLFYIPASAPVISFLIVLGCKWTSIKAKKQAKDKTSAEDASQEKV
ncbi:major facilitator superfamily domain-containing protein [Astrocystis sublimbata]|nr:major facilitator superfamily domain-containing protein [Astrocystis sublimbata]